MRGEAGQARAWLFYGLALAVFVLALVLAARVYPGGFDWQYTVVSRLASRKHNPQGSAWFAVGLAVSMLLLWPVFARIGPRAGRTGSLAGAALMAGLVLGAVVGLERLVFFHASSLVRKGHEALALLAFLCLYAGLIGAYAQRIAAGASSLARALPVLALLALAGLGNLAVYLLKHDRDWVGPNWRDLGIPVWESLAFWQWLTVAVLWLAVAQLLAMTWPGRTSDAGGVRRRQHPVDTT